MSIGQRIKQVRKANKITQDDLAEKIGTTKQTIYKYENGIITNIPSTKIELIAKTLNVTPDYLMGWDEEKQPTNNDRLLEALKTMTDDEIQNLIDYADYLKSKRNN